MFRHQASLRIVLPLLVLAAVLHGWNMLHSPVPDDDEGTYISEAWSVQTHLELSHYTYWYDHPPLGWLFLALWNELWLVLPRGGSLWNAGREAMLAVHLLSCVLLYVLARRLSLPRWAAGVAVAFFTLSPLGLAWQRLTLLDNIGTPLLIGGWVLALSPRRRLAAYLGSGLALAAAVLVKETNALFVPFIASQLWLTTRRDNARFALTLFSGGLVGLVGLYPLYATIKGELLSGPGHVSLLWALQWQLFSRPGSGSVFNASSDAHSAVFGWLHQDGILLIGALVLAPFAWRHRQLRVIILLYLLLMAVPLRGGYLPTPYPINLVWPAALLAASGLSAAWPARWVAQRRPRAVVATVVAICLAIPVLLHAGARDSRYLSAADDRYYRAAETWLLANTNHREALLVDNTVWLDLIQHGYSRTNVVWFSRLDLDPAVQAKYPGGWRAMDYVVVTPIMEATQKQYPQTRSAIAHGNQVAEFGDIRVLRVRHND